MFQNIKNCFIYYLFEQHVIKSHLSLVVDVFIKRYQIILKELYRCLTLMYTFKFFHCDICDQAQKRFKVHVGPVLVSSHKEKIKLLFAEVWARDVGVVHHFVEFVWLELAGIESISEGCVEYKHFLKFLSDFSYLEINWLTFIA